MRAPQQHAVVRALLRAGRRDAQRQHVAAQQRAQHADVDLEDRDVAVGRQRAPQRVAARPRDRRPKRAPATEHGQCAERVEARQRTAGPRVDAHARRLRVA